MPDMPSAEVLKRMRLDRDGTSSVTNISDGPEDIEMSPPKSRRATVEDVDEDEDQSRRNDTGDFAPGGDADYFAEEDDEGRFYGGGLTSQQKDILSIFEKAANDDGVVDDGVRLHVSGSRCVQAHGPYRLKP